MAWTTLTADEIRTRLSGPELDLVKSAALESGQQDPLPEVIVQVINEVRGYILAYRTNKLGPQETIPPQLQSAAISIIRWRMAGRVAVGSAGSMMQSESRRKEYEDAMAVLKDVAAGKFVVEQPEIEGPEIIATHPSRYGSDEKLTF